MILYVETNFLIEIAIKQEQSDAVDSLLLLAESARIDLCYPAFCLGEAFANLDRRSSRRNTIQQSLSIEARELGRSGPRQGLADGLRRLSADLASVKKHEADGMDRAMLRLVRCARAIPVDGILYDLARHYATQYALSPQDAIVYGSAITDLKVQQTGDEKLFLSLNSKDFDSPAIRDELALYNCGYRPSFTAGLNLATRGGGKAAP